MATFTDVFERKEVKYRLSARQHSLFLAALEGIMAPDAYGRTPVVSRYFDTPERALIDRSLEKPLYKEKLRLRSYGAPQEDDRVFIEIKKKFKGIVYKRRVGLSYAAARAYLDGMPYEEACVRHPLPDAVMAAESLCARSRQIAREIDRFAVQHRPLQASMSIVCARTAYVPPDVFERGSKPDGLRITFDEDIRYRDLLAKGADGAKPLLGKGEVVMEVKSAGPFPLWLVHALGQCRAYPTSFSKYGEAYRACAAMRDPSAQRAARSVAGRPAAAARPAARSVPRPVAGRPPVARASGIGSAPRHSRSTHSAQEEAAERLAVGAPDAVPRRFSAPDRSMRKGGRCA